MPNSYVEYTSVAGGTTNLNVPFSYLDPAMVELYIDDVLQTVVTHYNFTSATNIALVTPTTGGEDILIRRVTEIDSALVTFSNAMLVDTDLNTSHLQNFYLHQEMIEGLAIGDWPILGTSITSGAATDGQVLTADGAGGVAWEDLVTVLNGILNPWTADVAAANYKLTGLGSGADLATAPALSFGDGDTGFWESADDSLGLAVGGTNQLFFTTSTIRASSSGGFEIATSTGDSYTVPKYRFRGDDNTGIAHGAADSISLVAGGVEALRVTETASTVVTELLGNIQMDDDILISFGSGGDVTVGYINTGNDFKIDGTALTADIMIDVDTLAQFRIQDDGTDRLVVDNVNDDVEIHGYDLRIYEVADTDYLNIVHDGTNAVFSESAGSNFLFSGGGNLLVRDGGIFGIYDATNADYMLTSLDGTDVNTSFLGIADWNITLPTDGSIVIDNGNTTFSTPSLTLKSDAPTMMLWDDGATADNGIWTIGNASETLRFSAWDDALSARADAITVARTANVIDTVNLWAGGRSEFRTTDHTATGQTSGAQVKDHADSYRDIGFNDLPDQGWGTSPTLSAVYAGAIWGKQNATVRTLTLEASSSEDFPVGSVVTVCNADVSGNLTITEGTGTTLFYMEPGVGDTDTAGGCTVGPGGVATIYRYTAAQYFIWGTEITP